MSITTTHRTKSTPAAPLFTGQSTTGPGAALPQPSADDVLQDALAEFVRHLKKAGLAVSDEALAAAAAHADQAVRANWGGFNAYIAVRRGMPAGMQYAAAIRRDHQQGLHYGAICRKYGLSKSTVYRILGQKEQADQ